MTKTCAHCGAKFEAGGSLTRGGVTYPLCHPNEGLDCYRLVTVYGEEIGARVEERLVRQSLDLEAYFLDRLGRHDEAAETRKRVYVPREQR